MTPVTTTSYKNEVFKTQISDHLIRMLEDCDVIEDTTTINLSGNVDQLDILGVLNSLHSRGIVNYETLTRKIVCLTPEGEQIVKNGSYEAQLVDKIPFDEKGVSLNDIKVLYSDLAKYGLGRALKMGWVKVNNQDQIIRIVKTISDTSKEELMDVCGATHWDEKTVNRLKKLNHIFLKKTFSYKVLKGAAFDSRHDKEEAAELTSLMIADGSWKELKFKKYNFDSDGIPPVCGALHPVMEVRESYRRIFLDLGFCEMPTDQYVELSLWNFDALFTPQQHPARDEHDTFFLSYPEKSSLFPAELADRIKKAHEGGYYNSQGYKYPWDIEKAKDLILRTHTTTNTARMLYHLAKSNHFEHNKTVKLFSIDKVFRNETLDATHLAEFHQMEGVIAGADLTLAHLIGTLKSFYERLGITKLRFKPAYNPYTEPSMEVFAWHEGLKKYVEVGNSGMFRKEVLLPLNLPPNIKTVAWGLSVERPTMVKYGIKNIRDFVGHRCNLKTITKVKTALKT